MNDGASIPRLFCALIVLLLCTTSAHSSLFVQVATAQTTPTAAPVAETTWAMAGANPQRTSWVADVVDPAATSDFGVLWYRPIEAYIPQNVQLIAGRGKIYLSTARGLYALEANSGATVWRYDTELPLGHSPTLAGDTIFVGGYDRRLHALDADTGAVRWHFAGASAGYSTNPLVVDGQVLLGNRDGYFYALDAASGALQWQYPAAGQAPLGPILYSAAYAEGVVYFATNDQYAYALDAASGQLKWTAGPLPGDGYQAWWPVIYKDLVIFSGASGYRHAATIGSDSNYWVIQPGSTYTITDQARSDMIYGIQRDDLFATTTEPGPQEGDLLGPTFKAGSAEDPTNQQWAWANGATVLDGHRATEYYEDDGQVRFDRPTNKPWRRTSVLLHRADGSEFTFDGDQDGQAEYVPWLTIGTKSGNQYPPVIMPDSAGAPGQIAYKLNFGRYTGGWNISRAFVMGWQVEQPRYLQFIDVETAIDEPVALSGAGDMVYSNLCCDRVAGWFWLNQPPNSPLGGSLWDYHHTLESLKLHYEVSPPVQPYEISLAPGYDEAWWESSMWTGLPRLYGGYGNRNAVYHNHGLQNPLIPYDGKLFVHRSNAIIALGPNPPQVPATARLPEGERTWADHEKYEAAIIQLKKQPMLTWPRDQQDDIAPLSTAELQRRLEGEITKLIITGHLRPGYYGIGQNAYPQFQNYFENPGDTLGTLALAYPYLAPVVQAQLRPYLQAEYKHYFSETMWVRTAWYEQEVDPSFGQLTGREWLTLPPEVAEHIKTQRKSTWAGYEWPWNYPQHNFYALWQYAKLFPAEALPIYTKLKQECRLQLVCAYQGELPLPSDALLADEPWLHNAYVAAYVGFLGLQELAGFGETDAALRAQVQAELDRLLALRATTFEQDQPWTGDRLDSGGAIHRRIISVARNFILLTPELGSYLHDHALDKIQAALDEYNWVEPYWFVARYEASVSEGVQRPLYDYAALFQAKAYALQASQAELTKYLDVSAFAVGDLFYIQNLVAAIQADPTVPQPTPVPTNTAAPSPTPTCTPTNVAAIAPAVDASLASATPIVTATSVVQASTTPVPAVTITPTPTTVATSRPTADQRTAATATCTPTPSDFLYLPLIRTGALRFKQVVAGLVIVLGAGGLFLWLRELRRK